MHIFDYVKFSIQYLLSKSLLVYENGLNLEKLSLCKRQKNNVSKFSLKVVITEYLSNIESCSIMLSHYNLYSFIYFITKLIKDIKFIFTVSIEVIKVNFTISCTT